MKLYNANLSPNCLRVRAIAFELGIELELVEVDLFGKGASYDELLAVNPNGKVPVLVDGDTTLWESRAIGRYLASSYPDSNLYPTDLKTRASIDQWSFWQAIHLGPAMQKVAFERVLKPKFGMGETSEELVVSQLKDVRRYLAVLEKGLGEQEWIAGSLSIADFELASTFMYRKPADLGVEAHPRVSKWIERMEERPSWQRAVMPLREFIST